MKNVFKNGMRKAGIAVLAALLMLSFCGCRSMIELALMDKEQRNQATQLDLKDLYSAAEGFHYPGFSWGEDFAAFQRATDFSVTDMEGYTDTDTVYTASDLHHMILDRRNDAAQVGCRDKDKVSFVSMSFDRGEDDAEVFAAFSAQLATELKALYGEPDQVLDHTEDVNGAQYIYKTMIWQKTAGGKITELQYGTATMPGTDVPNFVSIGVDWLPEETDETK